MGRRERGHVDRLRVMVNHSLHEAHVGFGIVDALGNGDRRHLLGHSGRLVGLFAAGSEAENEGKGAGAGSHSGDDMRLVPAAESRLVAAVRTTVSSRPLNPAVGTMMAKEKLPRAKGPRELSFRHAGISPRPESRSCRSARCSPPRTPPS